jgi:hypothetical protein
MESGWVKIFSSGDQYLVSIAKDLLSNSEIDSVVLNHKDSAYVYMGEVELYVNETDVENAKEILNQLN